MNRYGERAEQHWARTRPTQLEELRAEGTATRFFETLGEEIAERISELTVALESAQRPTLNAMGDLERIGRLNALRSEAEELALDEYLPPPDPTDPTGSTGVSSPSTTLEDRLWAVGVLMEDKDTPMPADRTHPVWTLWETWTQEEAPASAGEAFDAAYRRWLQELSPAAKDLLGH